jgi:hypothetical protein
MCELAPLPERFAETRDALHRVAVHVLARRRHALCGRFGLRATPLGFGTPTAGPDNEVVRTSGSWLLRERFGAVPSTIALDLRTSSLADAARFAAVDLSAPFDAGDATPPVGDPVVGLRVDHDVAAALGHWYTFGWSVLDAVVGALPEAATPSALQLWPEHFDAGCDVAVASGARVNLGASPGDAFHSEPYLYVGPWEADRPGDPSYWNAPFGAIIGYQALLDSGDPRKAATAFLQRGLDIHA